jgi:hypothetical protein
MNFNFDNYYFLGYWKSVRFVLENQRNLLNEWISVLLICWFETKYTADISYITCSMFISIISGWTIKYISSGKLHTYKVCLDTFLQYWTIRNIIVPYQQYLCPFVLTVYRESVGLMVNFKDIVSIY